MPTSAVCVDASLIVQLLLDPHYEPIASLWRQWSEEDRDTRIVAPTLVYYEVTNAVYQQHRQKRIDSATVISVLTAMLALPILPYSDKEIHLAAYRLATRFGLSATYDSHYLATAEAFDAELWTADRKLVSAVSDELHWVKIIESS